MIQDAFVVVHPSIFAKNKQAVLISNIKKILKTQNLQYSQIHKDDDLIVIQAADPVFASSSINLLFGIDMVSISKCVENKFDEVAAAISKMASSLLLRGEVFYVKVEGNAPGYLPKDLEVAATSIIVEKLAYIECKPGTEEKHDKMIYCYLTQKNAYVSIFSDKGHGGLPYNWQNCRAVCCIYDELSAISCLETIRQGFSVDMVLVYTENSLLELVKIINKILPRTLNPRITLEVFKIPPGRHQSVVSAATHIACMVAKDHHVQYVSLSLTPLVFPIWYIEQNLNTVVKNKLRPWVALAGIGDNLILTAKQIGLGKYLHKIKSAVTARFTSSAKPELASKAVRKTIKITIGPNNVHEILDAIKS